MQVPRLQIYVPELVHPPMQVPHLQIVSLILLSTLDPVSKSPLPTIPVPSLDARCSCIDAAIALELKFHDFKPPNRVPG